MTKRRGGHAWMRRGVLLGAGLLWGCHGPAEISPEPEAPEDVAVTPEPPGTGPESSIPVEPSPPPGEPGSKPPGKPDPKPPGEPDPKPPLDTAPHLDARRAWWRASYYGGTSPESLVVGDFDGNGAPDVAVSAGGSGSYGRYHPRVGSARVLRNDGRGGLNNIPPSVHTLLNASGRIAAGDVNADGLLDVMVGASYQTQLLLGTGGGALRDSDSTRSMGRMPTANLGVWTKGGPPVLWSLGVLREVRIDYYAPRFYLARMLADGTLQQWEPLPTGFELGETWPSDYPGLSAAVADFNEDGLPDVVFSSEQAVPGTDTQARIFLADGADRLVPGRSLAPLQSFERVLVADFNRDGHEDLLVLYRDARTVGVLLGSGKGGFSAQPTVFLPYEAREVALVALDTDGLPDVVALHPEQAAVSLLKGLGQGGLESRGLMAVGRQPSAAASADLDADGQPELLVVETDDNTVSVYKPPDVPQRELLPLAACPLNPQPGIPAPAPPGAPEVRLPLADVKEAVAGDFDADGRMDLALTLARGGMRLLLHESEGQFATRDVEAARGAHASQPAAGDFDGDGRTDLAVVFAINGEDPSDASRVHVLWNDARDVFSLSEMLTDRDCAFGLLAEDVNGDGLADLAMTPACPGGDAALSVSLGQRRFRYMSLGGYNPPSDDQWDYTRMPLAAADFNGDGTRDIVHLSDNGINLNPTTKAGNLLPGLGFKYGWTAPFLAAGDADGDGKADVVSTFRFADEPVTLWRGDGFGSLQAPMSCALPRGKTLLAWKDMNGDGLADAVSLEDNGRGFTLWVMLRAPGGKWGALRPHVLDQAPAWVLPVDLRGDARPELAVLTKAGELLVFPPLAP